MSQQADLLLRDRVSRGQRPRGQFLDRIATVQEFLKDPWLISVCEGSTVQIPVPKVAPPRIDDAGGGGDRAAVEELLSAQNKRAALQKKAAVASLFAENFARRFEFGTLVDASEDSAAGNCILSNVKVMCQLCFSGDYAAANQVPYLKESLGAPVEMLPCDQRGHRCEPWNQPLKNQVRLPTFHPLGCGPSPDPARIAGCFVHRAAVLCFSGENEVKEQSRCFLAEAVARSTIVTV